MKRKRLCETFGDTHELTLDTAKYDDSIIPILHSFILYDESEALLGTSFTLER